jgi:phasin family protein
MPAAKSPFMFDPEKFREMFKMPEIEKMFGGMQIPGANMDAMMAAQQKNVDALVEANKIAMAGYQEIFQRQVALFEAAVGETQKQFAEAQGKPMSADQAQKSLESMRASVEKALANARELAELAQKANTSAFEVIKTRFEEAVAELKDAGAKAG